MQLCKRCRCFDLSICQIQENKVKDEAGLDKVKKHNYVN